MLGLLHVGHIITEMRTSPRGLGFNPNAVHIGFDLDIGTETKFSPSSLVVLR
jgi:hypothetical protein